MSAEIENDLKRDNQRLQNDKNQIVQEIEQLPVELLNEAIQKGLEQGKRRASRGRRKRLSLSMSISAVCIMLVITAFVRVSPAFANMVKDIPGFSGFVEFIQSDKSLLSAVENEFIQPINLSAEKNGFKFTVDGILADDQRLVILYTAEGSGINGNTGFLKYELKTGDGADVEASIMSSHYPSQDDADSSVPIHDYLDILMGDGIPMPERIQFSLLLGEEWLKVEFPIDHERFAGMREDISIDQHFEVGGQRFTVKNAIITPLQVSLTFEADPNNDKHANHFINMALVDEKGRRYETNTGFGDLNPSLTRHFKSSYFERPKKLTLVADGLHLSDRNLSITVDTDKMETISSPQNKLKLISKEQTAEGYELKFDLEELDETNKYLVYTLFKHDGTFKDASGNSHPILGNSGTSAEWGTGDSKITYYYRIPKADYKQPLTFDIEQYPGYVMEPVRVPIK
ncbi:hypothetical protein FHS15_005130 [Paenibacillus castaneae]|uniref:DUF4179 domain-containing protein n=1 Tax=Paenibacillus castaneae TaxID=474957 RepID=UPI000C9ADFEB|nr:DUF4179 domain-containing protein [Paenibacillus castaneae]NIK79956.1 hypothetical protein [Paenibacillus castaneae]